MRSRGTDEPIRVLRVIARLNVGGPALHVAHLSKGLDERGYETILAAGSVGAGEGSMEYVAEQLGVKPLFVPSLQRDVSPLADVASVVELTRLIRRLRPDILHTHTAKAGAVGRAAARLAGDARPRAVVHTFHGHVLRGYFGAFETEMFRRVERRLGAMSDALIAVSPEVRDDLVRLRVAPAERISVIRLGLDLEERVRRPEEREPFRRLHGLGVDAFVVAWLGRMTEIKRVDDLLAAFAELRRSRDDAELLLAGDGPLRAQLEERARSLGIASHCRFTGFQQDVAAVFAACDAVALTSANEGTPVTLIEALAAERPVVSTAVGGVADVVQDGVTGLLCDAGDTVGIAAALERLAESGELRAEMGRRGRESVVSRYSVPRLIEDIDSLYRGLLAREDERVPKRHPRVAAALPPTISRPEAVQPAARRLRVLIVSQYFPPEVGATQSRMQSFAEYLALRGHDVTVVAEFPNHPHGVLPDDYRGRLIEDDRSNPYRVIRVWVKASREKTQATRMAFYLSFMGMAAAVAPLAGRVDVVLATSPPLFTALAGLAVARANRAPFVLDVRDLWPAAAVSLNQIEPGLTTRAAEALERMLYIQAAQVVAVTRPFCEHIDAIRSEGPLTALVPNGTLEHFFVDADRGVRAEYGLDPSRYLVTFAGTHGIAQGLPAVVDAASRAAAVADFAFVGEGPVKDAIVRLAEEKGVHNARFVPQLPLDEVPRLLAASDALLVPLSAHPTFAQFVPSKMVDFMAAGRPVLASIAGEGARILEQAGGGIAVAPEDPVALARAVQWLAEHPGEAATMGERGRIFARSRLRSKQAERLESILFDVCGRRRSA